jgi:hypothetical protein
VGLGAEHRAEPPIGIVLGERWRVRKGYRVGEPHAGVLLGMERVVGRRRKMEILKHDSVVIHHRSR